MYVSHVTVRTPYFFRTFGTPVSLRNRDRLRLTQGFESRSNAVKLTFTGRDEVQKVMK